jgi:hypothetical protein
MQRRTNNNHVRQLNCTTTAESVAATGMIQYIPRQEALVWRCQGRDWRRVKVEWRGELYLISQCAWDSACPAEPTLQRRLG